VQPTKEKELANFAKKFRQAAGKSKSEAARELKVAPSSIFNAEERPELSLTSLRIRLIEAYSPYRVQGPVYILKKK
jgi:hypothetical protein